MHTGLVRDITVLQWNSGFDSVCVIWLHVCVWVSGNVQQHTIWFWIGRANSHIQYPHCTSLQLCFSVASITRATLNHWLLQTSALFRLLKLGLAHKISSAACAWPQHWSYVTLQVGVFFSPPLWSAVVCAEEWNNINGYGDGGLYLKPTEDTLYRR